MALPFERPNPYGSYFSWGEDVFSANTGAPPFGDNMLGFAPGLMAAMGKPAAGFNPTAAEFQRYRARDLAYQQFIANSLQGDTRAASMTQAMLSSMSRSTRKSFLERLGGPNNLTSLASFALNTPGIAEYFGGSQRSIAFGSLAAATGGMQVNGLPNFGSDSLHLMFADQLQKKVMDRFTLAGGSMNLMASHGLNRDQLGGVMALASAQGAFAGLDMGKIEIADQKAKMIANPDSMQKIERFLQSSAKALGNLMDVYGKMSAFELAAKAQQITGLDLSRIGNADLIQRRLSSLRTTAEATGIDVQTMFDLTARAGDVAESYGLPRAMSAQISQEARYRRVMRQQDAGAGGFYFAVPGEGELQQGVARDISGMVRDPIGGRIAAVELMMQNRSITGEQGASLRQFLSEKGATGQSVAQIEEAIQKKFGYNLSGYIQAMGGPLNMLKNIDPNRHDDLTNTLQMALRPRTEKQIEYKLRRLAPGMNEGTIQAAMSLYSTMKTGSIAELMSAIENGQPVDDIINGDFGGRERPGAMRSAAQTLSRGLPKGMRGSALMAELRQASLNDPMTSGYTTRADAVRGAEQRRAAISYSSEDMEMRGKFTQGNFSDAFWNSLGGTDSRSLVNIQAEMDPNSVFGLLEGGVQLDREYWRKNGWINSAGELDRDKGLGAWHAQAGKFIGVMAKANVDKWRPGHTMTGGQASQWAAGKQIADPDVGLFMHQLGFAERTKDGYKLKPEFQMMLQGRKTPGLEESLMNTFNLATDPVGMDMSAELAGMGQMAINDGGATTTAFRKKAATDLLQQTSPLIGLLNNAYSEFSKIKPRNYESRQLWQGNLDALKNAQGVLLDSNYMRSLSPEERDKLISSANVQARDIYAHLAVHAPKNFQALMEKQSFIPPAFASQIFQSLRESELKIMGDSKMSAADKKYEKENIEAARTVMEMKGLSDIQAGESRITGTMTLKGAALDFVGKVVNGAKASPEDAFKK